MRRIIDLPTASVSPLRRLGWIARWGMGSLIIIVCTFILGLLVLLLAPWDRSRLGPFAIFRVWSAIVRTCYGLQVEKRGVWPEIGEGVLILSNHRSYMDIPALFAVFEGRLTFVLKSSLIKIPFWGWIVGLFMIATHKGSAGAHRVIQKSQDALAEGRSVVFFPEGHRTTSGRLMAFRSGAFRVAAEVQCHVVLVYLAQTDVAMPRGSLFCRPARVSATLVGIHPSDSDARQLQSECEQAFQAIEAKTMMATNRGQEDR